MLMRILGALLFVGMLCGCETTSKWWPAEERVRWVGKAPAFLTEADLTEVTAVLGKVPEIVGHEVRVISGAAEHLVVRARPMERRDTPILDTQRHKDVELKKSDRWVVTKVGEYLND